MTETTNLSSDFLRLYGDAAVFASFSTFHPISFNRVLPFPPEEPVTGDPRLLQAETAQLANPSEITRRDVLEAYFKCGLLPAEEVSNLKYVIDFFDADFFQLMGMIYANAGMFRCALRWYRELIQVLETQHPNMRSDEESVYADVGYSLYASGLLEEAIAWSKSCLGPHATTDAVFRALIHYETQPEGVIRAIERSGPRTRYTIGVTNPADEQGTDLRLREALRAVAPFEEFYLDWISHAVPQTALQADHHPLPNERDIGSRFRHKMNLVFSTCALADELIENNYTREAKRLLCEAIMLAPQAEMVWERLRAFL